MEDTDWYLLDRGGRRHGPYERGFVEQLAARQELLANTPVWHPGLARWEPAGRVLRLPADVTHTGDPARPPSERTPAEAARPAVPSHAPGTARPPATRPATKPGLARRAKPRPVQPAAAAVPLTATQVWQRVFAGAFDLLLVAVTLRLLALYAPLSLPPWLDSGRFALLVWAVLDGWLLARVGVTPGKALMAVTVRAKGGDRLDERRAWLRSAAVPLALALMSFNPVLGFFGLLALGAGLLRLRAGRSAWWDDFAGSEVSVVELSAGRRLLAGLALAVLAFVAVALSRYRPFEQV
jgi:hypothetical protein